MARKAISWVLFGVFGYIWWWTGNGWTYLNTVGNQWAGAFTFFTLVTVVVLIVGPRPTGTGMFDRLIGTFRGFLPTLPWMVLGMLAFRGTAWARMGLDNPVDHFTHAIVVVLCAGILTTLWYGAIQNASD